jgi:hypothetical protein
MLSQSTGAHRSHLSWIGQGCCKGPVGAKPLIWAAVTIPLAHLGFAVAATDISLSGVKTCIARLAHKGLTAGLACHEVGALSFLARRR